MPDPAAGEGRDGPLAVGLPHIDGPQDLSDAFRFLGPTALKGKFQGVVVLLGLLTANPHLLGRILFAPRIPRQSSQVVSVTAPRKARGEGQPTSQVKA